MHITVQMKENYGNPMFYPVCEKAKLFAEIAGTKTLTPETLRRVKMLGFNINLRTPHTDEIINAL